MTDLFWYHSGALLQALNPAQTLVGLVGQPFMDIFFFAHLDPSFAD